MLLVLGILVVIIIIIILIVLIILVNKKDVGTANVLGSPFEQQVIYQGNNIVKKVDNANKYFTIEKIVRDYFENVDDLNNYQGDEINKNVFSEDEIQVIVQERKEEAKEILENTLAEDYKNNLNNSLKLEIDKINNNQSLEIKRMYIVEKTASINIFFIMLESDENISLMCITDSANSTFMIFPMKYVVDNGYNNIQEGNEFNTEIENISKNEKNQFSYTNISQEQLARLYFSNYKELLENNPDELYDKLFPDYATKRFSNKDSFIAYVDKNIRELSGASLTKYLVNKNDTYNEYVVKDQYDNTYVFKEEGIMNYELELDTYTIMSDNFKSAYDKADVQGKTMLNSDKWIQMLNNRDYTSAYNVLDETFRNNNFGSVDNFENYMRQNYGEHYDVEFGDFSNEGNTYVQPVTLKNILENGENKKITIIMRLNENYEFTMSFTI